MKKHVTQIQTSCNKAINKMLMLYKGLIRSKMEYCSFIYEPECSHVTRLEKIQFRAIRCCTALLQSPHTKTLEVLVGIPPIRERFRFLAKNYVNVCEMQMNHPLIELFKNRPATGSKIFKFQTSYSKLSDT